MCRYVYGIIICCFLLWGINADAQNMLKLDKRRPVYYLPGSEIKIRLNDRTKIKGVIEAIAVDYIEVNGVRIYLNEINSIYIKHDKFNYTANGYTAMAGGAGFALITLINSQIAGPEKYISHASLGVAAGIAVAGVVLILLDERRIAIKGRHTLAIISPSGK